MALFPRLSIFNRLILNTQNTGSASPVHSTIERKSSFIGMTGISKTILRPVGKAVINGQLMEVQAENTYLSKDSELEVIAEEGNRIIVKERTAGRE